MLGALAEADWISPEAARELDDAYRFLRVIEHRMQMVADEQTHVLPDDEAAFDSLARFSGFADAGAASKRSCARPSNCVQGHYAALFEDADDLGTEAGSLVFTGGEDDPETLETLDRHGLPAGKRDRRDGPRLAFRPLCGDAQRPRPRASDRDHAGAAGRARRDRRCRPGLHRIRPFPAGLPAGVQLFSLLKANPSLLDLIATILGTAPRLAEELSRRPKVLDAVLDPGFFGAPPKAEEIASLAGCGDSAGNDRSRRRSTACGSSARNRCSASASASCPRP